MDPNDDPSFFGQQHRKCYVEFYMHSVVNEFLKETTGEVREDQYPYVLIVPAGQNKTEFRGPVQERHKREYPEEWKAFVEKKPQPISGISLNVLPILDAGRINHLQGINIRTVEQLADLSDINLYNVGPGAVSLRAAARAYLAKSNSQVVELQEQLAQMRKEMDELRAASQAPRRGRPPKVSPAATVEEPDEIPMDGFEQDADDEAA